MEISGKKNRVRVYYLSWLKSKILRTDNAIERRAGWINVGDLQGAVHFKIVKYERIKFLVIALRDSIEIYAWAPKPYHKFMAFKSFSELQHKPLLVDLTVEEGTRLKVRVDICPIVVQLLSRVVQLALGRTLIWRCPTVLSIRFGRIPMSPDRI